MISLNLWPAWAISFNFIRELLSCLANALSKSRDLAINRLGHTYHATAIKSYFTTIFDRLHGGSAATNASARCRLARPALHAAAAAYAGHPYTSSVGNNRDGAGS